MPFTLDVQFGGLCMFVEREAAERGLYVLMPWMRHPRPDPTMDHFATLLYDPKYAATPQTCAQLCQVRLNDRTSLVIGDMKAHKPPVGIPPELAAVSDYAGGRPVDSRWFTREPADCLSARVRLPLGLEVEPTGKQAKLKVKSGGSTKKLKLVGLAWVKKIDIADSYLDIDGTRLVPQGGKMEISLVNLTQPDIDDMAAGRPTPSPHKPGDPVPHFQAFYHLLDGWCPPPQNGPDLIADDEGPGGGLPAGARPRGVDPYRCTLGFGGSS